MFYREICSDLARPFLRKLPAKRLGAVSKVSGTVDTDIDWHGARRRFRTFRNDQLNATFFVDMAEFMSRWHYYGEYFYDTTQLLLARRFLAGRDSCYVDVGANVGVHSTTVAMATAGRCRVTSFEPNPRCYRILQTNLTLNGLFDVRTHNVGLADSDATMTLSGQGDNTAMFSLRGDSHDDVRIDVAIRRGDDLLADLNPTGPLIIKIDTEGYEHFVLRGLWKTLQYDRTALSVEIVPAWLEKMGSSATALFDDLHARNFRAWRMEQGGSYRRPTLTMTRTESGALAESSDIFFAKRDFSAELWDAAVFSV